MRVHWFAIAGLALLSAGCAVAPVKVEKEEHAILQRVEPAYRPSGQKPPLPVLTDTSGLTDFIHYALLNNPAVEMRFYQWKQDLDMTTAARYLPPISLTLDVQITDLLYLFEPGIMTMLTPRSKTVLDAEAASLDARKSRLMFEGEMLKTAFAVKKNAYLFRDVRQKETSFEESLTVLKELEVVADERVKTGKASVSDVLRIQREKAELLFTLAEMKDTEQVILAGFGAALGLPYGTPVPAPPSNLLFTEKNFSEDDIWNVVQKNNPELASYRDSVTRSGIFVKRMYKEYLPDWNVSLMKSMFSEMLMTEPGITVSLPWKDKVKAVIAAAENASRKTKAELAAKELDLAVMMADALFRWRQADREAALYRDELLPRVRVEYAIQKDRYLAGSASLDDLFMLLRQIIDYSRAYDSARALRQITLSEISFMIRGDFPPEEAVLRGGP